MYRTHSFGEKQDILTLVLIVNHCFIAGLCQSIAILSTGTIDLLVARLLFRTMLWVYFAGLLVLTFLSLVFTAYFPGAGFYLVMIRM